MSSLETQAQQDRRGRILYIIEATVEHFISQLISETYLAKIATNIGISDTLTGIITSIVSLGAMFQAAAIFLSRGNPIKRKLTFLYIFGQTAFALIYLMPLLSLSTTAKTILFMLSLFIGHLISNIISPMRTNMFMSMIEDGKRGVFTANKEIISLSFGILYSFLMGSMFDHFEARGEIRTAFAIAGLTLFTMMVFHTLTIVLVHEKPQPRVQSSSLDMIRQLASNKTILKVVLLAVLWSAANYATTPFYGTYKIKELGFSMTFVSLLTIGNSVLHVIVARPLGRFGDRHSFVNMLLLCFGIEAVALLVNVFTVPENGYICFTIYFLLHGAAMAGMNSGTINLVFELVEPAHRTGALGLKNTFAGLTGFVTTLIMTLPFNYIQQNGNRLFGIPMYAQQFLSFVGLVLVLIILVYLRLVLWKLRKNGR